MARLPGVVAADQPLHVIQRGNNRPAIFFADQDYYRFHNDLREADKLNSGSLLQGSPNRMEADSVVTGKCILLFLKVRLFTHGRTPPRLILTAASS